MACPEKWGLNSEPLAGRTFIRQCKYFVKIGGEGGWGAGVGERGGREGREGKKMHNCNNVGTFFWKVLLLRE